MADFKDDDLDFLGGRGPDTGDRVMGALFMLLGALLFMSSFGVMSYETNKGLESHNMHVFLTTFAVVMIVGMPFFVGGIMLFKRGMRRWSGKDKPKEEEWPE